MARVLLFWCLVGGGLGIGAGVAACGSSESAAPIAMEAEAGTPESGASDASLTIANWNLEWFGSPDAGPTDEAAQQSNVAAVMRAVDADLWAVQEVSDDDALRKAGAQTGHEVLVASDARVTQGVVPYANVPQRVAVLYRASRLEVRGARVVLGDRPTEFNGRCPLEVDLATRPGGAELTVIVVHLAAGTDDVAWQKRAASADLLKGHVDAKPATARVLIAGDFNDGTDSSSVRGRGTPFASFLADTTGFTFATGKLVSPRYPRVIDHQLLTNDLAAALVPGSARVVDGDALVTDFVATTSDHDPVRVVYALE